MDGIHIEGGITLWSVIALLFGSLSAAVWKLWERLHQVEDAMRATASAGDQRLWDVMETRHKENTANIALVRAEVAEARAQASQQHVIQAEAISNLRQGIEADRNRAFEQLLGEIHHLQGR